MGWLSKILNIFKNDSKEAEETEKEIYLSNLGSWVGLRAKELIANSDLDEKLINYINSIKDKRWLLECHLDEWQKEVDNLRKNENKEERDVNLRTDLKSDINLIFADTRKLLDSLKFSENTTLENVLGFNSYFEEVLRRMIRKIENSEFAENFVFLIKEESTNDLDTALTNPLLKELIELDVLRGNFEQKVSQSGYHKIITLRKRLALLEDYTLQIKQLNMELSIKREKLAIAESKMKEKEARILELKENYDYLPFKEAEEKRKITQDKIENNNELILSIFFKLKPLLKKYKELNSEDKLINSYIKDYLEDPVFAFLKDEELKINRIIQAIRTLLETGRFSSDTENTNSFLEILNKVNFHYLEELKQKSLELNDNLKLLKEHTENRDLISKLEEEDYRLQHFTKQKEMIEDDLALIEDKISELNEIRSRERDSFQNLTRIGVGKEINIIFDS
ncbi:MAG: hypothetical protein ABH824_07015 [Nanoarchaeota archaeon]